MIEQNRKKTVYLFDWGNTLMIDFPGVPGKMCDWQHVEAVAYAKEILIYLSEVSSVYVATAAKNSTAEEIAGAFRRVGLDLYINGYFCRENTGYMKPDKEFYLIILRTLNLSPGAVTMVGDSFDNDILPCYKLGMKTVWLHPGPDGAIPEGVRVISKLNELLP